MRLNLFGVVAFACIAPLLFGCQQTTSPMASPLTPISPFSASIQLSPIQPTSGIGPLGDSTRVPPPPTNSYNVPNNYMGGTAPIGSTSGNFNGQAGFVNNSNPNGWVEHGAQQPQAFGTSFNTQAQFAGAPMNTQAMNTQAMNSQPLNNLAADRTARPQLGGMRVIDLTQAPAPPGYSSNNGFPGGGFSGGMVPANNMQQNMPQNMAQNNIAPQNPGFGFNSGVAPASFEQPAYNNQFQGSAFRANENGIQQHGFQQAGMQQTGMQQTGPIADNTPRLTDQSNQLQWRRPALR